MNKVTKEVTTQETDAEIRGDDNRFGNWPELIGLVLTAIAIWMIFEFRG